MKKLHYPNNYLFYHFASFLIKIVGNIYFGGKVIGKDNIPASGRCILAGNHVSNYDSYLLFKSTKRPIHILGKIELFQSKFAFLFRWMHLIPVNRKEKNNEATEMAIDLLKNEKVIGIFPEGTFHKKDILLPFKPGVINFSLKSDAPIIPFAIIGQFKFRSKPKIVFGPPIYASKIKGEKVKYLENVIKKMLED